VLFCSHHCQLSTISQLFVNWLWSIGQLNCCWPLPPQSFLASSLAKIHEQDLCSLIDACVSEVGSPLRKGEGSVFLCRHYVYCTIGNSVPNCLPNCCWSWPAQRWLVPSLKGLVTIIHCPMALGAFILFSQPGGPSPCICVPQRHGGTITPQTPH
jgi:hypothetical protein